MAKKTFIFFSVRKLETPFTARCMPSAKAVGSDGGI